MSIESFLNKEAESGMEIIKEKNKNVYLYIACYNNSEQKEEGFIAVTKAMLYDEVAIDMENLGDHAILFTSALAIEVVKNRLKETKTRYLLIDLSLSYDLESIYGFLPQSTIGVIKKINQEKFSKEKPALKNKLSQAVEQENFELAAPLRDFKKDV